MASYTIEDIELIRNKSGISYQEAVALLDYHNGNVARALIDLERNGRIQSENNAQYAGAQAAPQSAPVGLLQKLYRARVHITKGRTPVANLSALFVGACFLVSPWTVVGAAVLSAVLGYKISYTKDDPDFADTRVDQTVSDAKQNARQAMNDAMGSFRHNTQHAADDLMGDIRNAASSLGHAAAEMFSGSDAPARKDESSAADQAARSYYQANPAATTYRSTYAATAKDVPTIQMPVQVKSHDGNVSIENESDGHNSATIG